MNFGNWNENIHQDIDQIKRMTFSQRIKAENITVNHISHSARIIGTEDTYDVTLDSCTCFDFFNRQLPCKHIYRLAHELGYFDFPKLDKKASKDFKNNLPAEIEHFRELYLNGAISGEKFNKIINALVSK